MVRVPDPRFLLRRVSASEWVIHDVHYADDDFRRVVCCVYETADAAVEVLWMHGLGLPLRYASVYDVMIDLERVEGDERATRPTLIIG